MLYLLTLVVYVSVFVFSLSFYSNPIGARAIYHGAGALVIDALAIVAGIYAIHFSHVAHLQGVGAPSALGAIAIGSVVSAMHLAKWIVRYRTRIP